MSILGKRVTCTNGVNTSAIESKRAKISSFLISSIIEPKQNDESSAVERDRETRTSMIGVHPSTANKPIKQIAKIVIWTL